MPINAFVAGGSTRELDEQLLALGVRSSSIPLADLPRLADASARPPDLLIIDARQGVELPPSLHAIRRQHPHIGVIIVAAQLDPAMMLEAMRAGVSEWITAPIKPGDLEAAVKRVSTQRRPQQIGHVFAFLGAKGGVGTTTVAVNVACELAKLPNGRTLLIDLHAAYGDASVYLGAEPRFSVLDALENTHRLDEAFFHTLVVPTKDGPDLLASSDQTTAGTADAERVRALIDFAAQYYRFVVLDCPRSDTTMLDALAAVSTIVIVANQELATLKNASRMANSLRLRFGRNRISVVISRFDGASEIGHDDIERVIGGKVQHLFPSDYRMALAALNRGRPLVVTNGGKLAERLAEFARALAGVGEGHEDTRPADKQTGFLGRLMGKRSQ